jgi:hypothetical protein
VRVRASLARSRRLGLDFDEAWSIAIGDAVQGTSAEARSWLQALEWSRPAWYAAYTVRGSVICRITTMID